MKKERERRLRVSSYKSRNKTAFCQNFCTGACAGQVRVGYGDDDRLRGRRGLVKEGEESKRVRALCFWEWGKPEQGRTPMGLNVCVLFVFGLKKTRLCPSESKIIALSFLYSRTIYYFCSVFATKGRHYASTRYKKAKYNHEPTEKSPRHERGPRDFRSFPHQIP